METITSAQNPKVKQVRKLRNRREREQSGLFVVDDTRDLARSLACGYRVAHAFYCAERDPDGSAASLLTDQPTYAVNPDLLAKLSYRESPSPLVAVLHARQSRTAADLDASTSPLILGLVDLRKPGNIGALLRTADATGFTTVLLIDTALDRYNPNVIRSSTGAVFLDNIYEMSTPEALAVLHHHAYNIIAATVDGEHSLYEVDFHSQPSAVILGTEDTGLDAAWRRAATTRVHIPMVGRLADSLNVSVSGAIFMAEALRQRR